MKRVFLLLLACAVWLCGCRIGASQPATEKPEDFFEQQKGSQNFEVQYIRTDGGLEELYPSARVIHSRQELQDYYGAHKDIYNLERREKVYADESIGFLDACDRYSDDFFENNKLLLVILEEPSGSIRHRATQVLDWYNAEKTEIWIQRIIPEAGTSDMAQWHLIFEVSRNVQADSAEDVIIYLDEEKVFEGELIVPPMPAPAFQSPPDCILRTPVEDVTMSACCYEWSVEQANGLVATTVTDIVSRPLPQDRLNPVRLDRKFAETVYLPVPETGVYEPTNALGYLLKFAWESPPSSVSCVCWPDTVWQDDSIPEEAHHFDPEGLFYAKEGGYIYEFTATWENNGSGFYGTAQYFIYIIGGADTQQ